MEIIVAVEDQSDEQETRRNPRQPRAKRLLDTLQRAAPELDAHARDVAEYADDNSVMRYTRRYERAITDALGRHVGLSADWANKAWPLDDDLFLFAEDDPGAYSVVRQREEDGEGYEVDEVFIDNRPAYASDHRALIRVLRKMT